MAMSRSRGATSLTTARRCAAAAGDALEARDHAQQRRLAAAGGTHQRHQFAVGDLEGGAGHGHLAVVVDLAHLFQSHAGHALSLAVAPPADRIQSRTTRLCKRFPAASGVGITTVNDNAAGRLSGRVSSGVLRPRPTRSRARRWPTARAPSIWQRFCRTPGHGARRRHRRRRLRSLPPLPRRRRADARARASRPTASALPGAACCPQGAARSMRPGLGFYDRLVDELLSERHRAAGHAVSTGICRRRSTIAAAG